MTSLKYWCRLITGAICLPIVFPWLVYKLYQTTYKNRMHRKYLLQDKIVFITGASSGLGEAMSHAFYASGCKLILAARRLTELERVKNDLVNLNLPGTLHEPSIISLDLNELNELSDKAKEVLAIHGRVDILINNGGMSYRGKVENTSLDVDIKLMVVNYLGQVALTKAVIPAMRQSNTGSIVFISSIQGKIAMPFRSAYTASKHALQAFCDTLRAELSDSKIHVCVINPGYIKTNLSVNAVNHDGTTYGIMDQTTENGMSPEEAAIEVLNAIIEKQKEVVLSPLMPKIAILLRFLTPSLYFHLMANRAKRIEKQQECEK